MAELTLAIKYKPLSKNTATLVCLCWAAVELAVIAWYFMHPELSLIARLCLLVFGAAAFSYPPFVIVSFWREGGTLIANEDGLVLPSSYWGFGPTISLSWKELTAVDVHTTESGQQLLLLRTGAGQLIKVASSSIPHEELQKLLLAMELWLPSHCWSERAIAQRDGLQIGAGDASFTQLWESELRRRYNATTFVPHDPGTKIGSDLTVLRQLAFGGFSAVYLAENSNKEKVVVKELVVQSSDPALQAKAVEQFEREARLLAKLKHQQIARVFDHFVKDGNTYMVIEFIEGENLREFVRRKGAQNEKWVWACAAQLAAILAYLHKMEAPIIHRDFTPENLLIGSTGRVTLVDFGAANEFTTAATGTLVGKQAYMPIEQIRGKAEPRSDLYALGCVLHWLLTGVEPEPLSICHPRRLNPDVSVEMDELVAMLTAMEAKDRFASADDLSDHIQKVSVGLEVQGHGA